MAAQWRKTAPDASRAAPRRLAPRLGACRKIKRRVAAAKAAPGTAARSLRQRDPHEATTESLSEPSQGTVPRTALYSNAAKWAAKAGSGAASVSEQPDATAATLRRREGTQAILRAVSDVEARGAVTETVEGRWSLIYSTNQAGPIDVAAPGLSQAVIDKTYATLFKNVPSLAGAQPDNRAAVSNIQTLDLTSGLLTNRVRPAM